MGRYDVENFRSQLETMKQQSPEQKVSALIVEVQKDATELLHRPGTTYVRLLLWGIIKYYLFHHLSHCLFWYTITCGPVFSPDRNRKW